MSSDNHKKQEGNINYEEELNRIRDLVKKARKELELKGMTHEIKWSLKPYLLSEEYTSIPVPNLEFEYNKVEIYLNFDILRLADVSSILSAFNYLYKHVAEFLDIDPNIEPLIITEVKQGSLIVKLKGSAKVIGSAVLAFCTLIGGYSAIESIFNKGEEVVDVCLPNEVLLNDMVSEIKDDFNIEYDCNAEEKVINVKINMNTTAGTYMVKDGDTLTDIAIKNGIDINKLREINNIKEDLIYPGQLLTVLDSENN
ncbi:LysM peptidoglycan-binding domain-containing protein [Halobacillus yeomjeoni]|uniref:LysM peptidoglycan-binding domain-containing protein n=1 Tax=Halobacillus yeomjeoni TaxID=311194 RepID=A0A931HWQ9_9BACI|nr:LysM peptidoglycan-binding domain-containing protein [Halobacillus yeomjeoni]MBH0230770.1 LysM peptidoglycan-binding domain-containing protein [Halobacillus yeomjeoni]